MEKMTKPANMLVQELMQQTMMESLRRRGGVSETGSHQRRDREGSGSLLVHIVVVGVVASQRDERAQAQAVGEEDLSGRVQPHLWDSGRASASAFGCLRTSEARGRPTSERTSLLKSGVM